MAIGGNLGRLEPYPLLLRLSLAIAVLGGGGLGGGSSCGRTEELGIDWGMPVRTRPGAIANTWIPCSFVSAASDSVNRTSAVFEALYALA